MEDRESRAAGGSRVGSPSIPNQITKIPCTDENGRIDAAALAEWLAEVRRMCCDYGRAEIGDICIGQLLAKAPKGENGMWPCEAVCEAMDGIASPELGRGFTVGVYNSRGVLARQRGRTGAQARCKIPRMGRALAF